MSCLTKWIFVQASARHAGGKLIVLQSQAEQRRNDWSEYLHAVEKGTNTQSIRQAYENAISARLQCLKAHCWQEYFYIWIQYALFEELSANNKQRACKIYYRLLHLLPQKDMSLFKAWLLAIQYELRRLKLPHARRLFSLSVAQLPSERAFLSMIDLELRLGSTCLCRTLYQRLIAWCPQTTSYWIRYAAFESSLGEEDRSRGIYELGISQKELDLASNLWKAYIRFERDHGNTTNVRTLYERLLKIKNDSNIWISYAQFEIMESIKLLRSHVQHHNCKTFKGFSRSLAVYERAQVYNSANASSAFLNSWDQYKEKLREVHAHCSTDIIFLDRKRKRTSFAPSSEQSLEVCHETVCKLSKGILQRAALTWRERKDTAEPWSLFMHARHELKWPSLMGIPQQNNFLRLEMPARYLSVYV